MYATPWQIDGTKLLLRHELAAVLDHVSTTAPYSLNTRLNLTIFRLACCCGLRVSEIAGLQTNDVQLAGPRSYLRIRHQIAKGGRGRRVPLWWDAGTLVDLNAWYRDRVGQGGRGNAPFVCGVRGKFAGQELTRATIRRGFLAACEVLGLERLSYLTIHHGRHTFIGHALAGGRMIAEVRVAAGHASLATTSGYLHVAVEDGGEGGGVVWVRELGTVSLGHFQNGRSSRRGLGPGRAVA